MCLPRRRTIKALKWASPDGPWGQLGANWEPTGSLLGAYWEPLGAYWETSGSLLGAYWELNGDSKLKWAGVTERWSQTETHRLGVQFVVRLSQDFIHAGRVCKRYKPKPSATEERHTPSAQGQWRTGRQTWTTVDQSVVALAKNPTMQTSDDCP